MKRAAAVLLIFMAALLICCVRVSAEEYAPRPQSHSQVRDGYTMLWFDIPEGTDVTYTTDGTTPTKLSEKYRGEKMRFEKETKLKLFVRKKGCKAKIYSYRVKVKTKKVIKPAALKKGDTIGIVAPSKYIDEDFMPGVKVLEGKGYKVKIGESCYLKYNGYAGTPQQRADDLNRFFADDEVDAIMCLRGGYGSQDILDLLDYDLIASHPKMLIGYSDITFLHSALYNKCSLVTIHGSMIHTLLNPHTEYTEKQLFEGMTSTEPAGKVKCPGGSGLYALHTGTAEGRLAGGNLSCVSKLIDTKYAIKGDHCILLLEDVHENSDSIDTMLHSLEDSGLTDRVDGIVFGEFTDCENTGGRTVEKVLEEFAARTGKPCIAGLPAGHDADNMFLPLGVRVRIKADKDGPKDTSGRTSAEMTVLESALS